MKKVAIALTLVLAVLMMLPILFTISSSFKGDAEASFAPLRVIPYAPTFESYLRILGYRSIGTEATNPFLFKYSVGRWFLNTAMIAVAGAVSSVAVGVCMAFAISKYKFRLKTLVTALIVLSLLIPGQVVFVQRFVLVRTIGLYNSLLAVIVPGIVSASTIWFLSKYMDTIPEDFLDMGRLDGLGAYGLLLRVIAPLCSPAIAALMAMSLVAVWGDYLWPLVVLRKPELYTIALGIREIVVQDSLMNMSFNPALMFAGATMAMVPGIVLFLAFQKYFITGMFAKAGGK